MISVIRALAPLHCDFPLTLPAQAYSQAGPHSESKIYPSSSRVYICMPHWPEREDMTVAFSEKAFWVLDQVTCLSLIAQWSVKRILFTLPMIGLGVCLWDGNRITFPNGWTPKQAPVKKKEGRGNGCYVGKQQYLLHVPNEACYIFHCKFTVDVSASSSTWRWG